MSKHKALIDSFNGLAKEMMELRFQNASLLEALEACVDIMQDLPTLNGLDGLAVLENARIILEKDKQKG